MKQDIEKIYDYLEQEQKELQRYFDLIKGYQSLLDKDLAQKRDDIETFLEFVGLPINEETMLAAINRVVNLREDAFLQVISGFEEEEQIRKKERAFVWVSEFYMARFERMLEWIEEKQLLNQFYRRLLRGAHAIGEVFSSWQSSWMAQIIYGINRELYRLFEGDEAKIFELLHEKNLLDKGHHDEIGDRSYSVLRMREDGSFERVAYAKAFKDEVEEAASRIEDLIEDLTLLEDDLFDQKKEWLAYFSALLEALKEEDVDKLILKWADVDRCWMAVTTPIQIGHPLEYYEDIYRKAVALEWDVRIENPSYPKGERANIIAAMFDRLYNDIGLQELSIYTNTLSNLRRVQIYVGRPMMFYGSEFNGLFSAQVVPNDEVVSQELGKKIFAYPDMILAMQRAKPKMRITKEVFGEALAQRFRRLLEHEKQWYKIYDITTIGHEYGHILWMDEDSEAVMNAKGMFKLAEEFKATSGGLVAYFLLENDHLWEELLLDHIQRSVSLIGWKEVLEVMPYYVEGLLHLYGLFSCEIFTFDGKLHVDIDRKKYEGLKKWYLQTYVELAKTYLKKLDSSTFLERYIERDGQSFLPKQPQINEFVLYYYDLYKKIGREVDK